MAYRVVWSPRAIDDVGSIAIYIAHDSKAYAASVVRKILSKARNLATFPWSVGWFLNLARTQFAKSLPTVIE